MPLFVWAHYATALIQVLGTPVLAVTLVLVFCERVFHIGIFDPALGGDPVLFQHLFWFYSHPAVYIMILPAMGVVSELISVFARKPIFGYSFVAFSSVAIAVLGFLVWGHHMFVSTPVGLRRHGLLVPQLLRGHPLGHQGLQLDGHAVQRLDLLRHADALRLRLHRPVHHRRADRPVPGLAWASTCTSPTPTSWSRTSTTSWWAARSWAYLGGLHYWWPKMTGRMYPEGWAQALGADHLPGLQPDLLPAVHPGLPGHAAPLPRLPARVPGAARALHRGRVGPGGGLPDAADLLHLVAALRRGGRRPTRGAPPAWSGRPLRRRRCTISTRPRW